MIKPVDCGIENNEFQLVAVLIQKERDVDPVLLCPFCVDSNCQTNGDCGADSYDCDCRTKCTADVSSHQLAHRQFRENDNRHALRRLPCESMEYGQGIQGGLSEALGRRKLG